ncbi:transcription factor HES-7-like [Archocentrus centrarchus]|uniref:transcription factor HES-7-like n=1 Tax=Archocentrus centrarchus TaxID=63155 RepID=UPI0011EA1CAF|nr:transcription factor HES-7-like [Archocentrus centrarchus]
MGPSAAMELLHEAEEATKSRKLIKSQVEKRRRERMNRSLERLRTMLLQEPHEGGTQHRVEKAEILEHTILFLQNTATGEKATGGGGSRKSSFQDGFSTCLQTASRFLGPEGKRSQLGSALDAAFAARLARSHSHPAGLQSRNFMPHAKFILRMLRQKSKLRLRARASGEKLFVRPYPPNRDTKQPLKQREAEIRAEKGATKQSPSQSSPDSQTLWRPWP